MIAQLSTPAMPIIIRDNGATAAGRRLDCASGPVTVATHMVSVWCGWVQGTGGAVSLAIAAAISDGWVAFAIGVVIAVILVILVGRFSRSRPAARRT